MPIACGAKLAKRRKIIQETGNPTISSDIILSIYFIRLFFIIRLAMIIMPQNTNIRNIKTAKNRAPI
jgi:hypothetical protein